MTGVSRSGTVDGVDHRRFVAVSGDATDAETVARLATGHDAVASALGPTGDDSPDVLSEMARAITEGMAAASVTRLVWTGGAGGLDVGPDTKLIETEEFPEDWRPVARAAIDALGIIRDAESVEWTYVAPAAMIEPGDRTGEYRTAEGELVTDDDGESRISMEDFAAAFVDELERGDAIGTRLGVGY